MPKTKEVYVCTSCGYEAAKWNGKCPSCNEWNTFELQVQVQAAPAKNLKAAPSAACSAGVWSKAPSTC